MPLDTRLDFAHLGNIPRVVRAFAAANGGGWRFHGKWIHLATL